MNQGSTGRYIQKDGDDHNDHNYIWQDGALLVDLGHAEWAAYVAASDQQLAPTDDWAIPKVVRSRFETVAGEGALIHGLGPQHQMRQFRPGAKRHQAVSNAQPNFFGIIVLAEKLHRNTSHRSASARSTIWSSPPI